MASLVLSHYWRSSSSYRVRIALGYKGLSYESVFVNLLENEQKKAENLSRNPIGHVPTLMVDGVAYVESVAIMELLEELYPEPPLLPVGARARARVRGLVETINAGTQPMQNLAVLERVGDAVTEQDKRVSWMKHFIARGLAAFEALAALCEREADGHGDGKNAFTPGPFAFGAAFTMADVCLVPQVYAARRVGVDLTAMPRVVRADAAARELPCVQAARPEAQPDAKV